MWNFCLICIVLTDFSQGEVVCKRRGKVGSVYVAMDGGNKERGKRKGDEG